MSPLLSGAEFIADFHLIHIKFRIAKVRLFQVINKFFGKKNRLASRQRDVFFAREG